MTIHAVAKKDFLRKQALARRGGHDADLREIFSARLAEEGLALARRVGARAVSVFSSIRDEPDTSPLIAALADAGFVTALPVTISGAPRLTFRRWRPGEPTRPGQMKIPEPLGIAPRRSTPTSSSFRSPASTGAAIASASAPAITTGHWRLCAPRAV